MENIRIYEEDGYIRFIMRPEDLMRLRYSTEAKTPFADFMDRWLTQMKTQVRENTMDGYRYAFEKHIKPFFTARGTTLATARPMDFQDFVNLNFDRQVPFHHAQVPEIRGSAADYPDESVG